MTYNSDEIFEEVDKCLSATPGLRLYELARHLCCSHPTIERVVFKRTSLSFRAYRSQKVLERSIALLREGRSVKEVGLELGYKWPENFSRFMRRLSGRSLKELKADEFNGAPRCFTNGGRDSVDIFNK